MKLITDIHEPDFLYECDNGHQFWADAATGDNMYVCWELSHKHSIGIQLAQCPECKEIQLEDYHD